MDTPESSASPPLPASQAPPPNRKHPYWMLFLSVLILIQAAAWAWAAVRPRRATAIHFGSERCYAFDLLPRAYVVAVAKYDPLITPVLGTPGSGWMRVVQPVTQGFVSDANTHLGFGAGVWKDDGYGGNAYYIRIPHYAIITILALALIRLIWLGQKRFAPGCCRRCGYDLRATPDRCPECGTVPTITSPS